MMKPLSPGKKDAIVYALAASPNGLWRGNIGQRESILYKFKPFDHFYFRIVWCAWVGKTRHLGSAGTVWEAVQDIERLK